MNAWQFARSWDYRQHLLMKATCFSLAAGTGMQITSSRTNGRDSLLKLDSPFFQPSQGIKYTTTLFTTMSLRANKEQKVKMYVQDLVRQHAKRVYSALAERNGLFYVCGYVYGMLTSFFRRPFMIHSH